MKFTKQETPKLGDLEPSGGTPDGPPRSVKTFSIESTTVRAIITLVLIFSYVIIVFGRALGWIDPSFEDVFLASLVGMAIGYVYGKEVVEGKLRGP